MADSNDVITVGPVTPADRAALQRAKELTPSWFDLDWQVVARMIPPGALAQRPTANDNCRPFSLI